MVMVELGFDNKFIHSTLLDQDLAFGMLCAGLIHSKSISVFK